MPLPPILVGNSEWTVELDDTDRLVHLKDEEGRPRAIMSLRDFEENGRPAVRELSRVAGLRGGDGQARRGRRHAQPQPARRGADATASTIIKPQLMVIGDGCLPALHSAMPEAACRRALAVGRDGAGAQGAHQPARRLRRRQHGKPGVHRQRSCRSALLFHLHLGHHGPAQGVGDDAPALAAQRLRHGAGGDAAAGRRCLLLPAAVPSQQRPDAVLERGAHQRRDAGHGAQIQRLGFLARHPGQPRHGLCLHRRAVPLSAQPAARPA